MLVAKIQVSGVRVNTVYRNFVPAGIIGAAIEISYTDDIWRDLRKTVVFRGAVTKDVVTDSSIVTIPPEVVATPNSALSVGVYGVDADGNLAIPTLWADLGNIRDAANPSGDTSTDPSLAVWAQIENKIGSLDNLNTQAKENLVAAINEAARTGGGAGSMELRVADGYVQYSRDGGSTWENLIAMADLKGDPGTAGKDGHSPVVTATKSGKTTTISVDGTAIATVEDGADGAPGSRGADGITPTIGSNGNWYLGETDTGKPSRGEDGATGSTGATGEKGADGKSAYQYAVDGGYTGTEAEFAAKLAAEIPTDSHINSLIDTKLGVIENGAY